MQPSPHSSKASLPAVPSQTGQLRGSDDLVYHAMTIAAMLMLLCSIWVF